MDTKIAPPIPTNESSRLAALCQYQILDTIPEKAYDDITLLAASICRTPVALISLIDANRQWFKAKIGLEAAQTPREIAFCAYTILQQDIFIVPDALEDERFARNPLVTSDPNIRFYAGVPLITSDGYALGSLVVIDFIARELEPQQIEALKSLGQQVVKLIELRRTVLKLENIAQKHKKLHKNRQKFFQRIAIALGLTSVMVAGAGFYSYRSLSNIVAVGDLPVSNYKVIQELEDIHSSIQKVAIAKHRYLRSSEVRYLDPYYQAREEIQQKLNQLKKDVKNDPVRQSRVAALEILIAQKLIEIEQTITISQSQELGNASVPQLMEQSKQLSDRVETTIQSMQAAENQSLQKRSQSLQANTRNSSVIFFGGILLNFAVLAIVYYFMRREISERQQVEVALEQERDFTFAILDTIASLVVVCDFQGKIVRFNRASEQATGYYSNEVKGSYLWSLFVPPEQVNIVEKAIGDLLTGTPTNEYEAYWIARDGSRRLIAWSNTTLRNPAGAVEYIIASGIDITERFLAAQELKESQQRYQDLFENASDLIQSVALDGRFLYVNRAWLETLGYSESEIFGLSLFDIIHPDDHAHCQELFGHVIGGERLNNIQTSFMTKTGHKILVEGSASCKFVDGKPIAAQSIFRDITLRRQTEVELQKANEQLCLSVKQLEQRNHEITLLSEISDVLQACRTTEEAYTAISTFLKLMFPDLPGGIFLTNASKNLVEVVVSWGPPPLTSNSIFSPSECWALRRGRPHFAGTLHGNLQCRHLDRPIPAASLCVPMIAQGEALGMLYLSSPESATPIEAKQQLAITVAEHIALALANIKLRQTLENQSIRDPLTGLFNRRYMEESLEREIQRCDRKQQSLGVIMLDVDHFKRFNDTFGHEAGDSILKELGQFLQKYVRGSDIACRYGGEEFTLILPEVSLEITNRRAEQIREGIKHLSVQYRHESLGQITLSLGVASFPEHGVTGQVVIRQADAALYRAKQEGRDAVRVAL
ncbi:diguanylate cyclase [Aliterella atlantica]|uniref:diguanylate cyclase n=1 Tax=Aliterella atlantica TaxID=1827278 RepID=UPI0005D3337C|nr:diguanylate cyclase [Aliterella atlantica]